jgi:hypothetical protein
MTTSKRMEELLIALGSTKQAVADKLLELGCRGNYSDIACPEAVYLGRNGIKALMHPTTAYDISDFTGDLAHDTALPPISKNRVHCRIPDPVQEFSSAFMAGGYPELRAPIRLRHRLQVFVGLIKTEGLKLAIQGFRKPESFWYFCDEKS